MPKVSPEQRRAKQAIANAKAKVRALMVAGKVAEATAHAEKAGFGLFEARLGPEYQNEAEPAFKALEEANAKAAEAITLPQAETPDPLSGITIIPTSPETHRDGWPLKSDAIVYRLVPNPRLVVVQLQPDGRKVSMLKGRGAGYAVHKRLRVFLVKTEPEALYDHDFSRT